MTFRSLAGRDRCAGASQLDVVNLVDLVLDITAGGPDGDHIALLLANQGAGDG
jgi:hypothetical protein